MSAREILETDIFQALLLWETCGAYEERKGYADWAHDQTREKKDGDRPPSYSQARSTLLDSLHPLDPEDPAMADGISHFRFMVNERGLDQERTKMV